MSMSTISPLFKHADRAAYELPRLFQLLGDPGASQPLTDTQRDAASAIKQHACNAQEFILDGIESIGHLMTNFESEEGLDSGHLMNLGMLLKHLAVEADTMRVAESDMRCILQADRELQPAGKLRAAK